MHSFFIDLLYKILATKICIYMVRKRKWLWATSIIFFAYVIACSNIALWKGGTALILYNPNKRCARMRHAYRRSKGDSLHSDNKFPARSLQLLRLPGGTLRVHSKHNMRYISRLKYGQVVEIVVSKSFVKSAANYCSEHLYCTLYDPLSNTKLLNL